MKKIILVCILTICFVVFVGCDIVQENNETSSYSDPECSESLKNDETDPKLEEMDPGVPNEPDPGVPNEPEKEDHSYEINNLEMQYNSGVQEIENKYANLAFDYDEKIIQYKSQISQFEREKNEYLKQIDKDIESLIKERDEAYNRAVAQSGGMSNSYAESIKRDYNNQISNLKSEKDDIISYYDNYLKIK